MDLWLHRFISGSAPTCVLAYLLPVRAPVQTGAAKELMEVRDLLRFEHCSRTVYKLEDPAGLRCPVCGVVVRSGLMEAPVRIQIPVGNGHRAACCFLIACRDGVGGFR